MLVSLLYDYRRDDLQIGKNPLQYCFSAGKCAVLSYQLRIIKVRKSFTLPKVIPVFLKLAKALRMNNSSDISLTFEK